ncbi:MAG: hypothetical protein CVV58_01145 [Tenericutes bacterium HGW-Tenericutes-3]|nr:MAG: hypothetical protein CVV58_01145 [Tenericutes bacterium HGW-Tenericutes-3]
MRLNILEQIDFKRFDSLLEGFNKSTGFVTAILDLEGNVISKSGWRAICTRFHRMHPETKKHCLYSDTVLANKSSKENKFSMYKCKNGLIDVAVPIIINDNHLANLFTGQFFLDKPDIAFFKNQAKMYGFNEDEYLEAIEKVPIVTEEKVVEVVDFVLQLTQMIVDLTIDKLEKEDSEILLRSSLESTKDFIILAIDQNYNYLFFNKAHEESMKYAYNTEIKIGSNLMDSITSDIDKINAKKNYDLALSGKAHTTIQEYGDHNISYYESFYNPMYDKNEEIVGATVLSRNITDRIKISNDLIESEERFKILHNASFGGIALHDQGLIIDCNQGLSDITGYPIDELIGMDGLLLIAPEYREFVRSKIRAGYEEPYEAFGLRKNNEIYPLKLEARNMPYQNKQVRVVEFRDITNIKQYEKDRKEKEKQYKLLFETMLRGVIFQDNEGNILSCNPKAEEILGLSLEQMQGKSSINSKWVMKDEKGNILTREDHPAIICLKTKQKIGPTTFQIFKHNTNDFIWVSVTAIPLFNEGDEDPYQVYSTFEDITERKRNEEALLAVNKRFETLFENAPLGYQSLDVNGYFNEVNQTWLRMLGYKKEEVIGHWFGDFLPEKYKNPFRERFEIFKKLGKIESVFEMIKKDGTTVMIEFEGLIGYDEGRIFRQTYCTLNDITERQKKEEMIIYKSKHDYLTNLPNRGYFEEMLAKLDDPIYYPLGIVMMDLDGLKLINDAFGHARGNETLVQVANILRKIKCKDCFVSRIGGDEFVMLYPNANTSDMEELKKQLFNEVRNIREEDYRFSISFGYSMKLDDSRDADDILNEAEDNMYSNKVLHGQSARNESVIAILNTLKVKYDEERLHSDLVSQYCRQLGEVLNFDADNLIEVELAGLMHDIGKITIPDNILKKPGKLDEQEWKIMKTHTINGYNILRSADKYSRLAEYALTHHERWDGNGYPNGLKGEEIPLISRVISICDAYEAMTSDRPYRKALGQQKAIDELIRCAGSQFDQKLVEIFIKKVLKVA